MARPLRIEYEGARYHIINRGNFGHNLFEGKEAAETFERTLAETAVKFRWKVHAYVVMRNHFHLALEITEPNLSHGMKWLQGTWTRRSTGLRRSLGRPFQDRYKSLIVEPGPLFGQVCHTIHLNPVRAGAVKMKEILNHAWGSLPKFCANNRPAWLMAEVVLTSAGELRDNRRGWTSYRDYLEFLSTNKEAKRELVAKRFSRGWCVGGKEFRREIREKMATKGAFLEMGRFAGLEPEDFETEREVLWEKRLQVFAEAANTNLKKMPLKKSSDEKVLLAAAMKQSSSVSNGWLAERLQMGQPATVSQFVRRWQLEPKKSRQTRLLLSRVKT